MVSKALRMCKYHGCRALSKDTYCIQHKQMISRGIDIERGSPSARGYGRRWVKARALYLRTHPLCESCKGMNRITFAECVDHIIPHRGDMMLFWDTANWQALCYSHHAQKTATEDGGFGHKLLHNNN